MTTQNNSQSPSSDSAQPQGYLPIPSDRNSVYLLPLSDVLTGAIHPDCELWYCDREKQEWGQFRVERIEESSTYPGVYHIYDSENARPYLTANKDTILEIRRKDFRPITRYIHPDGRIEIVE